MQDRKLRICIVTGDFPALTETFITTKVLELAKRGHSITVIKNIEGGSVNQSHLELVKEANIKILSFRVPSGIAGLLSSFSSNPGIFLRSASLSSTRFKSQYKIGLQDLLLNKQSFDIIHFEFSGLAVQYIDVIKKLTTATVVSCRGTAEKVKPISDPKRKQKLEELFSAVTSIHCVSADMASTITKLGANQEKIFINRPSIDAEVFKRTKPYNNNSSRIQFLTIGRFTFQKGYLIGLMAMRDLKQKGVQFTWTIIGDGPQREELLYHIHALQLENCAELVGKKNRDEILEIYNTIDVFVLPSVYEGIANVCLEAMAMELPVVSTKSGGMEEVIINGENGMLCEVYDTSSLVAALQIVAGDIELRKKLGLNARKTILENFTLQRQVDVFEAQYHKLLKN